jgi:Flp pilus assembly protein TadD
MRSLRSGVAVAAIAMVWSSAAFGFNLFGSSDDSDAKPKPAPQAQTQPQPDATEAGAASFAKTLAANLDSEIEKAKAERVAGDLGNAAHAFAQMVLVAPDNADVCGEYGKTLVLLGRSDDAIAFLKRAIQMKPNDWTLYSAIGAAFDQKGAFADAKTAYQRGLQINPTSAALLNNYAMSQMLAGDLPAAQSLIAQAQTTGNDPKIAHNAMLMANLRGQQPAAATPRAAATPPAVHSALPKPVATAKLPAPQPPKAVKTAAKPTIVKTQEGRVMMQAVPKDPQAGPVKTAEAAEPAKSETQPVQDMKIEATAAPHALAAVTPDLRAAAD